eukprot:Skav227325  [mRNA]  locus=scaffold4402:171363:172940:+ [translate_table: standard]
MPTLRSRRGRSYASPRVSFVSQQKGADAFKHACFRLGRQPANEILADLRDHGALVLDVQLCRDLEPFLIFLKEAPRGIHQVMIYDGYLFFGADSSYQEKLQATTHRMQSFSVLKDQVQLWRIMRALLAFTSLRGTGLAVLELTGLPLHSIAPLLARTLSQTPSLQRLHLEGCGLRDRGLAQLLPQLGRRLVKLSHLSLAQNGLQDLRLVARLLHLRAAAQQKRQVVPLNVLDLSKNPWLGATRRSGLGRGAIRSWQRREQGGSLPVSREDLLRVICLAFRNGLVVKKIRLRNMGLRRDDLRPLQQLLRAELATMHAGYGGRLPFPLAELSLEGNPIEAPALAAISHALQQLSPKPSYFLGPFPPKTPADSWWERPSSPVSQATLPTLAGKLRRTQSQPTLEVAESPVPERRALSEADIESEDVELPARVEMIQEFQEDLQILFAFMHSSKDRRQRPATAPPQRTEQQVSLSEDSAEVMAAIPDMGLEMGFGPQVLAGTYSHTATPPDEATVFEPETGTHRSAGQL